jgi:hypothetical protein
MKSERLNLWDRFFNRYRKILIKKYIKTYWAKGEWDYFAGTYEWIPAHYYTVQYGLFKKIDRLTGSETEVTEVI